MSNATVSSQVYIVRNNGTLAAVSTGTMIVFADGTDLYAKDANGNTYNLTHPSASNLSLALNNLTDVSVTGPVDNQILQYNSTSGQWENADPVTALTDILSLADLSDVSSTAPSDGQALVWSNANQSWEPGTVTATGGNVAVEDLTNVVLTSLTTGEVLQYNGTNWVNTTLVEDFSVTDGTNSLTVTDGYTLTMDGGTGIDVSVSSQSTRVQISLNATTDLVAEGTNQYFTTARVDAHLNTSSATTNQILSWNGTDYAWVADQTGTGTGSSAGTQYDIQVNDGSSGFTNAGWKIGAAGDLFPVVTDASDNLGAAGNPVGKAYLGEDGIKLVKDNTIANKVDGDYASISTDGSIGYLNFKSIPMSSLSLYRFKATDGSPAQLYLESGNGSTNNVSFTANPTASGMQDLTLPPAIGTDSQVLALDNVSGTQGNLVWADANPIISHTLVNRNMGYYTTDASGGPSISDVPTPTIPGGNNIAIFAAAAVYGATHTLTVNAFWPFVYKKINFTSFVVGFANLGLQAGDTFDVTIELRSVVTNTAGMLSTVTFTNQPGNTISITLGASQLSSFSTETNGAQGGIYIVVEISNISASSSSTNPEVYFDIELDRKES